MPKSLRGSISGKRDKMRECARCKKVIHGQEFLVEREIRNESELEQIMWDEDFELPKVPICQICYEIMMRGSGLI